MVTGIEYFDTLEEAKVFAASCHVYNISGGCGMWSVEYGTF